MQHSPLSVLLVGTILELVPQQLYQPSQLHKKYSELSQISKNWDVVGILLVNAMPCTSNINIERNAIIFSKKGLDGVPLRQKPTTPLMKTNWAYHLVCKCLSNNHWLAFFGILRQLQLLSVTIRKNQTPWEDNRNLIKKISIEKKVDRVDNVTACSDAKPIRNDMHTAPLKTLETVHCSLPVLCSHSSQLWQAL